MMETRLPGTSPACPPKVDSAEDKPKTDIVALSRDEMRVVDTNGATFPITELFDRFADETDDWAEARVCIAGPDPAGFWWTVALADFGGSLN